MAIINERWPRDVSPESCAFGRSRNDIVQESARTRETSVIAQGRPLWSADLSWALPNGQSLAKLRYWLESLEGYQGSTQIWDFASPYPYGLNLAMATGPELERIFWSYLGNRAPFSYAGLATHWTLDATVPLNGAVLAGATSIDVDGLDAGKVAVVQGQYVQVGRRIYLAAATVAADGSGEATIALMSPLLTDAADNDPVRLVEAACEMRLANQNWDARSRATEGLTVVSAAFIETAQDYS